MEQEYIICVDDELIVVQSLRQELKRDPYFSSIAIEVCDTAVKVLPLVDEILAEGGRIPVILSDQRMPGMNGDTLLLSLREKLPDTLYILLTGFADIEAVVRLVNRQSLHYFISKPWNRDDLLLTVKNACDKWRHARQSIPVIPS